MLPMRRAIALKYDVEPILNAIDWIPDTLHGFDVEPDTMVDMLFLHALDSFENCSYFPHLPVITDQSVLSWFNLNHRVISDIYRLIRTPRRFAGWEASYLRLDNTVWIHYLY